MVQVTSEGLPLPKNHADSRGYPHFYPETYVLRRGDPALKEHVATQDFLHVLMRNGQTAEHWKQSPPAGSRTSYRRRALADWLTDWQDGAGHLVARVIVNRLWQHLFGRGIVSTANDFGTQGEPPTHPELLDWLAAELIRGGWRLKPIHKLIMTSSVYMQDSRHNEASAAVDPENRYLWRYDVQRIEAEVARDSMLAMGNLLDLAMFGPGTLDESMRRRSIYFTVKRSRMIPCMQLMDMPESLVSIADRASTTIAPQALMFLNSPHVWACAQGFADRIGPSADESLAAAVREAYRIALSREPADSELNHWLEMIEKDLAIYSADGRSDGRRLALANFCQMVMSMNEFTYVK
jgi:hypothetical protein